MPQQIRIWEVTENNTLTELPSTEISLEERLEDWLESDISMLDPDLLVIGRQVHTAFGGAIDLLCLDSAGSVVVVELKRGRAPQEVTAQVLEYASWVKDLGFDQVNNIAASYWGIEGSLADAFNARFGGPLPSSLNESHRSLIVAESPDASTERIVQYLSDLNVPINVATVQHFKDSDGKELLAQVFLVEPEVAATRAQVTPKRTSLYGTVNDIQALADDNGIGGLYGRVRDGVRRILYATPYTDSVGYYRRFDDGGTRTVMFINAIPATEDGGLGFTVHATRFDSYLGINLEGLKNLLPENSSEVIHVRNWNGSSPEERTSAIGLEGIFNTTEEVDKFIDGLRRAYAP